MGAQRTNPADTPGFGGLRCDVSDERIEVSGEHAAHVGGNAELEMAAAVWVLPAPVPTWRTH